MSVRCYEIGRYLEQETGGLLINLTQLGGKITVAASTSAPHMLAG